MISSNILSPENSTTSAGKLSYDTFLNFNMSDNIFKDNWEMTKIHKTKPTFRYILELT